MRTLLIFVVYYAVFAWPWWRLVDVLAPAFTWTPATLGALFVTPAVVWIASRRSPVPLRFRLARLVYVWLGAGWLLLCLSVPWELVYLLVPLPERVLGAALLALFAVLLAVAVVNGNRLSVVPVHVALPGLTRPIRVAQLSDVHVGSRSPRFLARVVRATNALEPDAVFVTGDLIDGRAVPERDLSPLAALNAPVWFVIGNHEHYVDCDDICARLGRLGFHVLRDACSGAAIAGQSCTIVGLDDADDPARVAAGLAALALPPERPRILLYHRPDGLEDAAARGIDLMLCGHTHNGQMVPFDRLVRRRFPRIRGLYRSPPTTLYVSVGTGTWGPAMRLGSVNELTLLTLEPASAGVSG